MIGETLGSYTVLDRIGAGGMGEVFLAQHTRIDRQAAIKVLLPELSSNKEMVDRFFAEARATSSIRHPGIVDVFDCNVHANGRAYIVMEMLQGESLASRLSREPALGGDGACALAIAGEIADAVGAAHAKGIVHRDLKPDNIFLVTDARQPRGFQAKVLDFGIAKLVGGDRNDSPTSRTRTGTLMGTPVYMSPEQCRGARQVDHRTDIYSLGCILFEMLAGRPPFTYEGYGELISAHMNDAPPSLASLGGAPDSGADELIERMLAKSPNDRPQTMAEVHAAIRGLETGGEIAGITMPIRSAAVPTARTPGHPPSGGGTSVLPTPSPGGTAVLPTPVGVNTSKSPVTSKTTTLSEQAAEDVGSPSRGPRRAIVVAMAGLGVTVVIGGVLFTQRRAPPPPPPEPPPEPAVVPPTTVSIEASDAPDELVLTVDGKAAHLPLTLPRSSDIHTLVFAARGFQERTLKVDASTSRMLTLAMQPEVAPVEPPPRIHEPTDQPPPVRKKRREVPPNILNAGRKL